MGRGVYDTTGAPQRKLVCENNDCDCGETVLGLSNLRKHIEEKTGHSVWCDICGLVLRRREDLHLHIGKEHPGLSCSSCDNNRAQTQAQALVQTKKKPEGFGDQEFPETNYLSYERMGRSYIKEFQRHENTSTKETSNFQKEEVNEELRDFKVSSDSGYASGIIVGAVDTQPQQSAIACDFQNSGELIIDDEQLTATQNVPIDRLHGIDEIASVLSDPDEIQSQAEIRKSAAYLAAEDEIRRFFALDARINSLCGDLIPAMGRDRFITTFRRLLKYYYKSQMKLAQTNIEKSTVFLLCSRFHRERVSISIADMLDPKEETRLEAEKSLEDMKDRTAQVQEWLMKQSAFTLGDDQNDEDIPDRSPDLSDDDETGETHANLHQEFPHISRMKAFLSKSSAFQDLLIHLHLLLIPSQFQPLARTLLAIPNDSIDITKGYNATTFNNFKVVVEEATKVRWNWWPLEQSIRPPLVGYSRIAWKCHCRRSLWQDVPNSHMTRFERLLVLKGGQNLGAHLCAQRFAYGSQHPGTNVKDLTKLPFIKTLFPHASGVKQTPAQNPKAFAQASLSQSFSSSGSRSTSRSSVLSSSSQTLSSATTVASQMSAVTMPLTDRFILFGISGKRRTLDLVHMNTVKDSTDDLKFFETLLKSYKSARGKLRVWFSIWQLHHCDFVKFKKIMPDRVVSMGTDLPSCHNDYSYNPRPPDPLAPAIDKHMWEIALLRSCTRTLLGIQLPFCPLSWFHDCIQTHSTGYDIFLPAIPQKHTEWLLKTPSIDYSWGIVAKEEPYLVILMIYHVLMFAGPFGSAS